MEQQFITKNDILFQLANIRQITFEVTDACNLKCKIEEIVAYINSINLNSKAIQQHLLFWFFLQKFVSYFTTIKL
jgi:hypothetical protein